MEPITKIDATASTQAEDAIPRRVIKRYSNRKLYDTKDSRYVTLLQIAELVRAGDEVQIIDNNTKEDLTEVTLAQIIYEEQKAKEKTLPLKTLKDLIHQRTEDVLSSLREGPIGRLIPGAPKEGEAVVEAAPIPETPSKPSLVDQAKGKLEDIQGAIQTTIDERVKKFEDFQHGITTTIQTTIDERVKKFEDFQHTITHTIDERVNAVLPTVLPWLELEKQVKTLAARVEELEAEKAEREAAASSKREPKEPEGKPAKKKR